MIDILYLGGLVVLALGFALYLYRRRERSERPTTSFRCVHGFTASGEPISYLLSTEPRDAALSKGQSLNAPKGHATCGEEPLRAQRDE